MATKKRNYKKEYANYHGKPKQIRRRAQRNASNRKMRNAGKIKKGDGRDVHHKDHNTANQKMSNMSSVTRKYNRSKNKKRGK
jgi:hypothetical protein